MRRKGECGVVYGVLGYKFDLVVFVVEVVGKDDFGRSVVGFGVFRYLV